MASEQARAQLARRLGITNPIPALDASTNDQDDPGDQGERWSLDTLLKGGQPAQQLARIAARDGDRNAWEGLRQYHAHIARHGTTNPSDAA